MSPLKIMFIGFLAVGVIFLMSKMPWRVTAFLSFIAIFIVSVVILFWKVYYAN